MKFFDNFDKVYLINLKRRPDRLEEFKNEVSKYDLGEFTVVEAVDGLNIDKSLYPQNLVSGEIGIVLSILNVIKDAKNKNYNKILVIEDDCQFDEDIVDWQKYLNKIPSDWDMFYFGGNHNFHVGESEPIKINEEIVKLHKTYSAHFTAINRTVFDYIEESLEKVIEPLDVTYARIQTMFNCYCTLKLLAKQRPGFSDIVGHGVDYGNVIVDAFKTNN